MDSIDIALSREAEADSDFLQMVDAACARLEEKKAAWSVRRLAELDAVLACLEHDLEGCLSPR